MHSIIISRHLIFKRLPLLLGKIFTFNMPNFIYSIFIKNRHITICSYRHCIIIIALYNIGINVFTSINDSNNTKKPAMINLFLNFIVRIA